MTSSQTVKELRPRPEPIPVPLEITRHTPELEETPRKRLEIGRKPSNPFIEFMPEDTTLSSHTVAMLASYA